MNKIKTISAKELDDVIYNALNSAIYEIQTHLGVQSGDAAGIFFSGPKWDELKKIMNEYVRFEEVSGEYPFKLTK